MLALDVYLHRLRAGIAAMAAALGGLDALVFTGGVGERAPEIRARAAAGLAFLGVASTPGATPAAPRTSPRPSAAARTLVVEAREDLEIARGVRAALALALGRQLALPALAALDPLAGQHAAGERRGRVERVQRLAVVPDLRVLLGEQQREPVGLVAVGGRGGAGRGRAVLQRLRAEVDRARGAEIGRQVAAGDLAGRPPQRAPGDLAVQRRAVGSAPPVSSARRYSGAPPVSSRPRSTGRKGAGSATRPRSAAIASATASACCVARPPCLTGKVVASPAA